MDLQWSCRVAGIALLNAALIGAASRAETATRVSTSWQVVVSPGQCSMQRLFLQPRELRFFIKTVPGSDYHEVAVIAEMAPPLPTGPSTVSLVLDQADGNQVESRFKALPGVSAVPGATNRMLIQFSVNDRFLKTLSSARTLSLDYKPTLIGPFPLASAGKAVTAYKECIADQLIAWGADPSQFQPGGAEPVAVKERDDWVPNRQLLAMHFGGDHLKARFKVSVTIEGSIDACTRLDDASANDTVEKIACRSVIGKTYFRPALDAGGKPVRGAASFAVELFRVPGP